MDSDNSPDKVLLGLYRDAKPAQKLDAVAAINESLISLKTADLAATNPLCSPEERMVELRRWWFSARD
jgi:hypothetical protein